MKTNQKGIATLEIIIILIILAVVGFVGWKVWSAQDNKSTPTATSVEQDQKIKSAQDLQAAEDTLNKTDLDKDLDTSELDSALQ